MALAQITNVTDDQSTPTPGAGHDYIKMFNETVNPANGSVSLRIDVPVPTGRGLTLPFSFAYDSNGAYHVGPYASGTAWWYSNAGFGQGGWAYALPVLNYSYQLLTKTQGNNYYQCGYVSVFVFQDPIGGRHALNLAGTPGSNNQCSAFGVAPQPAGGDDQFAAVATQPDASTVMVTDRVTGTAYVYNVGTGGPAFPVYVEDRNGNRLTYSINASPMSGTVTDTLGRTLTISTGNPQSVQVPGPLNYQVSWTSNSLTYPAVGQTADAGNSQYCAQNPIPGFGYGPGGGSQQVVSAITMPNGQQYTFVYDGNYGLLQQIYYPSGGTVTYTWGMSTRADHTMLPDSQGNKDACGFTYDVPTVNLF